MKRIILSVVLALLVVGQSVRAEGLSRSRQAVKVSSDVLLVAMPVATASAMLAMKDWTGFKQAAFTGLTTLGATYLLKFAVHKERPDHSNNLSFPSGHTSVTFANAAFVPVSLLLMASSKAFRSHSPNALFTCTSSMRRSCASTSRANESAYAVTS